MIDFTTVPAKMHEVLFPKLLIEVGVVNFKYQITKKSLAKK